MLYDAERGVALLGDEEIAAAVEVLRSRSLFRYYGPQLLGKADAFEAALAQLVGARHALAVSSGTAALECGLVGLGVPEGAEVIVPAITFVATVGAVLAARAVPVFAEVDDTLCLDPASVRSLVTERTAAIIPVHLANVAADMTPICDVAQQHGLAVLEDAAQAIGVTYGGAAVGTIGDAGIYSFNLEKNITCGEGGALVTNDERVWRRAARYHDQGGQFVTSTGRVRGDDTDDAFVGTNLRMTELAAAIAHVQLSRLQPMLESLRGYAHEIRGRLDDAGLTWRRIPDEDGEGGDLTVLLPSRRAAWSFVRDLRKNGMPASMFYGGRPVYANAAVATGATAWGSWDLRPDCPRSEALAARAVNIALGVNMTPQTLDQVEHAIREAARAGRR